MSLKSNVFLQAISLLALLVLWQLAASIMESRVLPPPVDVLSSIEKGFQDGELPYNIAITLSRVAASFVLAMAVGIAVGIVMGRNKTVDRFFDGWLVLFLNIPALVTIILCYVWFGLIEAAAIAAVAINKIPTVIVTVREGARALSPGKAPGRSVPNTSKWPRAFASGMSRRCAMSFCRSSFPSSSRPPARGCR
jgi:NitT/TauT family transport system permease protein